MSMMIAGEATRDAAKFLVRQNDGIPIFPIFTQRNNFFEVCRRDAAL
ncbi:MAG: hypothetical protein IJ793_03580 [Opitutales bacterium]|nr:hypothetical protein [Opitutales bacterium]